MLNEWWRIKRCHFNTDKVISKFFIYIVIVLCFYTHELFKENDVHGLETKYYLIKNLMNYQHCYTVSMTLFLIRDCALHKFTQKTSWQDHNLCTRIADNIVKILTRLELNYRQQNIVWVAEPLRPVLVMHLKQPVTEMPPLFNVYY